MLRKLSSIAVLTALAGNLVSAFAQTGTLQVTVSEGDGAFNNIKKRLGRDIRVEVRDEAGQPIAGADVTFTAPAIGPSVSFGKTQTFSTKTDTTGSALTVGLVPNNTEGRFNIRVSAESQGRSGAASLAQTNTTAGGIGGSSGGGSKKGWIFALISGAAAAGIAFAVMGSDDSNGPTVIGPPVNVPISVTVGTVTVGGPR